MLSKSMPSDFSNEVNCSTPLTSESITGHRQLDKQESSPTVYAITEWEMSQLRRMKHCTVSDYLKSQSYKIT